MSVLQKYTRKPTVYVHIPTNGMFTPDLKLSATKEVGIMPQTLLNEVSLQNPEELLNGEALIRLIKDCTDINIDPRDMPKIDIDLLLVAIRAATHGDTEEYELVCPHCESENTFTHDISYKVATAKMYEAGSNTVDIQMSYPDMGDLVFRVFIKPITFGRVLESEHTTFGIQQELLKINSEVKKLNELTDEDEIQEASDAMAKRMTDLYKKLSETYVDIHSKDIEKVEIYVSSDDKLELQDTETDQDSIEGWFKSLSKDNYKLIKDKAEELNNLGIEDQIEFKCPEDECGHVWNQTFEINRTDFFVKGS